MRDVVYFGAGTDGERALSLYRATERVLWFADNAADRHGTAFHGVPIRPPADLLSGGYDYVRITSGATFAIFQQLLELGIPADRIKAPLLEPENLAFLAGLRDKHKGQRAFIVGNGPSLKVADLEKIHRHGDLSFAFNKIYLIYGESAYRPTYYMVDDFLVAQNNAAEIGALTGYPKLFPDVMLRYIPKTPETFVFSMTFQDGDSPVSHLSEDPRHLYSGATVTYSALQMALIMGCNPIYLIGLDFSFSEPPPERRDGNRFTHGDERNHFHPDYRKPGEVWYRPAQRFAALSFETARRHAEGRGLSIFNATRGGKLEVFPRVDLDSLFAKGGKC